MPPKKRCAYCGAKTAVHPGRAMSGSAPLARYPHSPVRLKFPPLCEASRQGQRAQVRASLSKEAS